MWFPSSIDAVVYSVLAALALYPSVLPLLKTVRLPRLAGPDRWQADSIARLIALQGDLESRNLPTATKLCRELIWEILGGDTP